MTTQHIGIKEYLCFLDEVAPFLDMHLVSDARDVEFGQWELPYEAVLLALIKLPVDDVKVDLELAEKLAIEADIIDSGVLDMDTWAQFLRWSREVS